MAHPERSGFIQKTAEAGKYVGGAIAALGVLAANAPAVFFGAIGYLAGNHIENRQKQARAAH